MPPLLFPRDAVVSSPDVSAPAAGDSIDPASSDLPALIECRTHDVRARITLDVTTVDNHADLPLAGCG
ncbi:hypothetical protein LDO31_15070 [Luteimonas sp. XNQY3]|nr:hypothetical protein [Luteimonas sp. XNQY3]MCD9007535.1 hypothetical protein [Luteimonas sp. XNQY3]